MNLIKTTTCKCGKINILVIDGKSKCTSCGNVEVNPKLDCYENQTSLTRFYSISRKHILVNHNESKPKKWKQTKISFI